MPIKFEIGIFWDLIKTFFVLLLHLWLQKPKPEISMTWYDLCFLFFFMVLISNKGSFYNLKNVCSYCFVYSYKIYNRALIKKMTQTK